MVGHRSFGQQLFHSSFSSILYGWEINKLSYEYKYFTRATTWFVVRKRSNHNTNPFPPPGLRYVVNVTHGPSQCALISQKYDKADGFRIQSQMHKTFLWNFRFLSSIALTPCIIQIRHLIFVLERSNPRFGKRFVNL